MFDRTIKKINAFKFGHTLNKTLKEYKKQLLLGDFDTVDIWHSFARRATSLILKHKHYNKVEQVLVYSSTISIQSLANPHKQTASQVPVDP